MLIINLHTQFKEQNLSNQIYFILNFLLCLTIRLKWCKDKNVILNLVTGNRIYLQKSKIKSNKYYI